MIKKRTMIRVISFLSVAILVLTGFTIREMKKSNYYLNIINNQYSKAFEQLSSSLNNISIAVEKTAYVTSAKTMSALSSEIFNESEVAKLALSELPIGDNNLLTVYRFLSQVGNYALSVSKNITTENSVSDKQRQELKKLSDTAKMIAQVLNDSSIEYNTPKQWASSVENKLNGVIDDQNLADSLTELEENLSDYPTLIYDGPYSDHILEKQPLMTTNAKEVSKSQAYDIVRQYVKNSDLKFDDMQKGKIESYRFSSHDTNIAISRYGGYVVYMRKNREIEDELLSYEQALSKAKSFLEGVQIYNMVDTYFYTDNGVCVINFAYLDGQTICYTDLIKVGVAMDSGEILLLETTGYLTNHTIRAFKTPEFTSENAAEKINSDLEIKEVAMTLIPTDSGGEIRCYEFLCKGENEQEILVYINVQTLEEEQIYILLKNDGGTLVK